MSTTERIAVVTGGARGIGAAVARRLSEDGMAVAVLDLDGAAASALAQELTASGGRAMAGVVDVSDEASVEAAVQGVAQQLGAPTVLVNNAGIIRDNLLFRMSVSDWDQVIGVHLRGAFFMSRAVQSHMTQQRFGRIVTMSSTSGRGNRGQAKTHRGVWAPRFRVAT